MKDIIKILLTLCFISIFSLCLGQPLIRKIFTEEGKAFLRIRFLKGQDTININRYEQFEKELTIKEQLQLIKRLLEFEGDTTRHVGRGLPIYYSPNEQSRRFIPKSKYYTIEICALYFIDRIAYDVYSDYYSPAPVLYDNEEGVEINDNPEKVSIVFEAYRKWFEECIKNEKIPKYYPFNDGRYVWSFGKKSYFTKEGTPAYKEPHF